MPTQLLQLAAASTAAGVNPNDVYFGDERHYPAATKRHVVTSLALLAMPDNLEDAEFHSLMATECLVKMLFCLARSAAGIRANTPPAFATISYARDAKHDIKTLAVRLAAHSELTAYPPWRELLTLIPAGSGWNEDRYLAPTTFSAARKVKIQRRCELVMDIGSTEIGAVNGL